VLPGAALEAEISIAEAAMETALREACRMGHMGAVEFLIHHGAALLKVQAGPLLAAASNGHCDVVRMLIQHGHSDVASHDGDGRTALHLAALGAHIEAIQVLMHLGAPVDARDAQGLTPADLAGMQVEKPGQGESCGEPGSSDDNSTHPNGAENRVNPQTKEGVLKGFADPEAQLYNAINRANFYFEGQQYSEALEHLQRASSLLEANKGSPIASALTDQAKYMLHRNRAHAARKTQPMRHAVVIDGCSEALALAEARNQTNPELLELRAVSSMELCDFKQACTDYETLAEVTVDANNGEKWKQCAWEAMQLRDANHYEVLCLCAEDDVDTATIKRMFFKLSKRWHPDKHNGEEEGARRRATTIFQRISEAYRILSDDSSRVQYDASLDTRRDPSGWGSFSNADSFTLHWFKANFDLPSTPPKNSNNSPK